jgi:hypothetical protein
MAWGVGSVRPLREPEVGQDRGKEGPRPRWHWMAKQRVVASSGVQKRNEAKEAVKGNEGAV